MLAHGSSNSSWSDAFTDMTAPVRKECDSASLAFMELSSPTLFESCREAAQQGYQAIRVLPLFLATGRHLKRDVPEMIRQLTDELNIEISLLPAIGENPILRKAITEIVCDELKPWIANPEGI